MAKISIERAPATALPRLYLLTVPLWNALAGLLLAIDGGAVLQTRWAPATLAVVHALTLGVMGNAMLGSLLQFLPAAAGVRIRGGSRAGFALYGALNLGAALLVAGFHRGLPEALMVAGALLAGAFGLAGAMVLPGLLAARGMTVLRAGFVFAVVAVLVTAAFGVAMLLGFAGHGGLPPLPWADVHAAWGVLGWTLALLVGVGSVVMPMFQGTRPLPAKVHAGMLAGVAVVVTGGTLDAWLAPHGPRHLLRFGGAGLLAAFALGGLWLQWTAIHARNAWLVRCWRLGLGALLAAAAVLASGGPALLAGALVLGIAIPSLVVGMQMEIVAFLGWIDLYRRRRHGVRLPAIGALLPDRGKAAIFLVQAATSVALLCAVLWPMDAVVRLAGLVLAGGQALSWWTLAGVGWRGRAFLAASAAGPRESREHAHAQ